MKTKQSILAFLVLIVAMLACQSLPLSNEQPVSVLPPVVAVAPIDSNAENPAAQEEGLVARYENVSPGTVAIITDQGQGSGFVYDGLGHIITNFHVIEGAQTIEVRFTSGFMAYGTIIGTDTDSDLAIIKVDAPAEELHPLPLGDSDSLKVGQTVVAIGNPFGLDGAMTVGIISALGRTLDAIRETPEGRPFTAGDIIQTDAAINPGLRAGGNARSRHPRALPRRRRYRRVDRSAGIRAHAARAIGAVLSRPRAWPHQGHLPIRRENDADGLELATLEDRRFLVVNGIQTMSHDYLNLIREAGALRDMGVSFLRLSPHSSDMVKVAGAFQAVLDATIDVEEAVARLDGLGIAAPYSNGFFHARPGYTLTAPAR